MRSVYFFAFLLLTTGIAAQDYEGTQVEARLFLPVHIKNQLTPLDKLEVYFVLFPDDTLAARMPEKTTAKKLTDNIYQFRLPATKLWQIGFSIGGYSYRMFCVNNRGGKAIENYDFNILLVPKKEDFTKTQFLPPCLNNEDE